MPNAKEKTPCQLPHQQGASAENRRKPARDDYSKQAVRLTQCPSAQRAVAEAWIAANRDVWEAVKAQAALYAANKRRVSVQMLLSIVRYDRYTKRLDHDPFKVNNTMIPALARLLIEECPNTRPFIETRKSACDWAFKEVGRD